MSATRLPKSKDKALNDYLRTLVRHGWTYEQPRRGHPRMVPPAKLREANSQVPPFVVVSLTPRHPRHELTNVKARVDACYRMAQQQDQGAS